MMIRALLVTGLLGTVGCGHGAGGKLMVDTTIAPYHAPDISEITGIDEDDAAPAETTPATPAAPRKGG